MDEDILRNLTKRELDEIIDKRIEERIRSRMIGQNDILPQTIKERHIDWEEFGATLNSSIIQKLSELVFISSDASGSATIADNAEENVTVTLSDNSGDADRIILAVIHVTAYETSVSAANAIPYGSSLLFDDYIRFNAHDWGSNDNLKSTAIDQVVNLSGAQQSVLWRANARYIGQSST